METGLLKERRERAFAGGKGIECLDRARSAILFCERRDGGRHELRTSPGDIVPTFGDKEDHMHAIPGAPGDRLPVLKQDMGAAASCRPSRPRTTVRGDFDGPRSTRPRQRRPPGARWVLGSDPPRTVRAGLRCGIRSFAVEAP